MTIYDFEATTIAGAPIRLDAYRGHPLLIVNVASACGYTPQYAGLEALYRKFKDRGLVILGFPCNQFGRQEPGTDAEIAQFCASNYGVTFPLFSQVEVNGAGAHPLFQFLKTEKKGVLGTEAIKWNFTKFLADKEGRVVRRYAPTEKPSALEKDVVALV